LTGEKEKALADAQASADLYELIGRGDGATLEDRINVGLASIKLGDLLGNPNFENLGRAGSANLAYAKALEAFRQLDRTAPTELRVRRLLGVTLERIGTMYEDGQQWTDAATAYQESYEIRRGLAEREPAHRDIQRDLGVAHEKVANVLFAQRNFAGATAAQRQALAVFEKLATADPADVNAARTVAISRENVAQALRENGGVTEALDLYRKALDAHRAFRTQDPRNVRAACDAARVAELLGDTLASADAPGACVSWRESQTARQSLTPGAGACATPEEISRMALKLGPC
jgi:tetratricopeptide (TPR) repeat protein